MDVSSVGETPEPIRAFVGTAEIGITKLCHMATVTAYDLFNSRDICNTYKLSDSLQDTARMGAS